MTVIDHNGTQLTGHAATAYHAEHTELIEVTPFLHYVHPNHAIADEPTISMSEISTELYNQLDYLGFIPSDVRSTHVGQSDYSSKLIQPWSIFLDNPELNYMECDVIKRILRTNTRDTRKQDLTKCKHIIDELIRQIDTKEQHDS